MTATTEFSRAPMLGTFGTGMLTGAHVRYLMRDNKITIRDLAARMGVTLKRVREVRKHGTMSLTITQDWVESILRRHRVVFS